MQYGTLSCHSYTNLVVIVVKSRSSHSLIIIAAEYRLLCRRLYANYVQPQSRERAYIFPRAPSSLASPSHLHTLFFLYIIVLSHRSGYWLSVLTSKHISLVQQAVSK
jgi:hypothetical protein